MCHFLPVYYLGIAFLGRGEGSKYYIIPIVIGAFETVTKGARGVMVIVAGYGHGDTSSNPERD